MSTTINMFSPDIEGVTPSYSRETAKKYDATIDKKIQQEQQETVQSTQEQLENQKISIASSIIQKAIYTEALTSSAYQFTQQENYEKTDINDKTDTYINMNTSYRYIKYNIEGAGLLYNKLEEGNNFVKDSPKKVFENIKNRLITLGFNQKTDQNGILTTFQPQNDADILYMVWFFQTYIEHKVQDSSKKDFRIGPKTLQALLDENNNINHKATTPTSAQESTETTNTTQNTINQTTTNQTIGENINNEQTVINQTTTNQTIEANTNNTQTTENNVDAPQNNVIQKETIGTREFPKTKDIYQEGTEQYMFTQEDLTQRGITQHTEFVPTIYETLQLESGLAFAQDAENLKEMLIKPRFKQMYQVILDMKSGITINGKSYEFSDNEIKNAIKNKWFSQIIRENEKLYTVNFDTRTPEMKKIENSVRPLGDKEYTQTEWEKGGLKEKYQIHPQGILYKWVKGINNEKIVKSISINNRTLKNEE